MSCYKKIKWFHMQYPKQVQLSVLFKDAYLGVQDA